MNKHTYIIIATILAGAVAGGVSRAAESASSAVMELAQHPQCFVAGDGAVIVRGAVAFVETREPAAGVTVVLAYGNARTRAASSDAGTYTATFPHVQPGAEIREVGIYVPATGSLLPLPHAQAFSGTCRPARVGIGAPQPVSK